MASPIAWPSPACNVVVSIVAQRAGHSIGCVEFFRYGAVVALASLVVSTGYLMVRCLG